MTSDLTVAVDVSVAVASIVVVAATTPMALRMSWVSGEWRWLEVSVVSSSLDPSKTTPGCIESGTESR
jgi:hypothetical protein